jgi:flagellar motility protein MotE (MotC chaperone)
VADANTEKSNYSGFERFLFFLTPILFTAVLLGMLLLLFNTEWRNKALEIGNKVPVLKAVLPDPSSPVPSTTSDSDITVGNAKVKVDELKVLLADREASLKKATQQTAEQKKEIDALKAQVDQLNKEKQQQTLTAEEYTARINSLAGVYAKMTPGKAAPILESMTLDETALILGAMADTERTRVLEKMTPQKAADVSIKLKDSVSVQDQQIAALQARVKELETLAGSGASTLDTAELKKTFSSMKAADAATLLLQMAGSDQAKTLLILGALDDTPRSQVLAAMSNQDSKKTASLVSKLMPANP